MIDLTHHPRLLKLLSFAARAKNFVLRRNAPRWRAEARASRNLSEFYNQIWRDAAERLGATIEPLGHDIFEVRLGEARTRVLQNFTAIDSLVSYRVVRTKPVMYDLLARHGLPVPRHREFGLDDLPGAAKFLDTCTGDCVVKPATMTGGGQGVVTGIRTHNQLARAAWAACAGGGTALIEEQVEGDNYRLLYLDGQLVDAVLRRPPTVVGDGSSTVGQLVEQANAARVEQGAAQSHVLLTLDLDMKRTLAKQGLSFRSVPAKGRAVVVKTAINENRGEDNEPAGHLLSEALVAEGARAAELAGLRLAGVDVVTRDPGVPLAEAGGVILEVNSPPGYYWHYHKRDGSVFPLAEYVLRALLAPQPSPAEDPLCPA